MPIISAPREPGERNVTAATVGFVGLGLMGEGFTRRLVEKGHASSASISMRQGQRPRPPGAFSLRTAPRRSPIWRHRARQRDQHRGGRGCGARPARPIAARESAGKVFVDLDHRARRDEAHRRRACRQGRDVRRCAGLGRPGRRQGRHARHHGRRHRCGDREDRAADARSRHDDAYGRRRHRTGDQARQPDAGADQLLRARRGAAARRGYGVDAAKIPQALGRSCRDPICCGLPSRK